tara:strand:+ start:5121 stop:5345 length:225 start_codon:yes stop_codon:yes gene_type:complete
MKAEQFSTQLLRQKNLKIELKDMKAHQNIIGGDIFKKEIKKEEKKDKVKNIEDIFDKGTNNKSTKKDKKKKKKN